MKLSLKETVNLSYKLAYWREIQSQLQLGKTLWQTKWSLVVRKFLFNGYCWPFAWWLWWAEAVLLPCAILTPASSLTASLQWVANHRRRQTRIAVPSFTTRTWPVCATTRLPSVLLKLTLHMPWNCLRSVASTSRGNATVRFWTFHQSNRSFSVSLLHSLLHFWIRLVSCYVRVSNYWLLTFCLILQCFEAHLGVVRCAQMFVFRLFENFRFWISSRFLFMIYIVFVFIVHLSLLFICRVISSVSFLGILENKFWGSCLQKISRQIWLRKSCYKSDYLSKKHKTYFYISWFFTLFN